MRKIQIHTTEQPDSDITTAVLSCDRLDILDRTLQSYLATKDYQTKTVILDDSGKEGIFQALVDKYGTWADVVCFPTNRSQWWAMDFLVSWCDTKYVFYLEDDWILLQSGYLNKSKEILEKYREIGIVDISWFTYDWQGIDSYDKTLIDDSFFYKKPWQITPYHLHWYGWCGSPNLKRRDDLILLGRIEKWHNEWNIDRKFMGLGFKAVFLNGKYADHIGYECSRMENKRPNDGTTPEDYFPPELLPNRVYPKFDYRYLDANLKHPNDITIVTALVDIDRDGRDFDTHYMEGLRKVLAVRHPIVVFAEQKHHQKILNIRGHDIRLINFGKKEIEDAPFFKPIKEIISKDEWKNQSAWMKDSVICNPYYIPLTLCKHHLLNQAMPYTNSNLMYWVDSGICSSYNIQENINDFYFAKIPTDQFFMTSFTYYSPVEMHGYSMKGMLDLYKIVPDYVCRATLFGGTKEQIIRLTREYDGVLWNSINNGYIGTEEAIYTILSKQYPELMHVHNMENGDIYNFLRTIK
jgi:hypothetical protein